MLWTIFSSSELPILFHLASQKIIDSSISCLFYVCVWHSALVYEDCYHLFRKYNVLIQKWDYTLGIWWHFCNHFLWLQLMTIIYILIPCIIWILFISSRSLLRTFFPSIDFFAWRLKVKVSMKRNNIKQGLSFVKICFHHPFTCLSPLYSKILFEKIIFLSPSSMKDWTVEMNCYPSEFRHLFTPFWK